mmetsp:Transcript_39116/g.94166  ORF Transcript_39116/g.94166 Transcript_39116/m.94166 type:complete len:373 (-) Transcript_39116:408-1526(-)
MANIGSKTGHTSSAFLTINKDGGPKHHRKDEHDPNNGNSNARIIHIFMMTAVEKSAGHVYALRYLVKHPPINVRVHGHDVVRRRELLPVTVSAVCRSRGECRFGSIVDGDMIILEVVVLVVHECSFVDASGFKIPIAQQPEVILWQLKLYHPVIRHSLEHGTLGHIGHDRFDALIDRRDRCIRRGGNLRVVTTVVPGLQWVFAMIAIHGTIHDHLFRRTYTAIVPSAFAELIRIGRVGTDISRVRRAPGAVAVDAPAPAPPSRIGQHLQRFGIHGASAVERVKGCRTVPPAKLLAGHVAGMGASMAVGEFVRRSSSVKGMSGLAADAPADRREVGIVVGRGRARSTGRFGRPGPPRRPGRDRAVARPAAAAA